MKKNEEVHHSGCNSRLSGLVCRGWPQGESVEEIPKPTQITAAPPEVPPGDKVYVPGFSWLECQGEGTVIHDDMMYEKGNKVGIMD